MIFSYPWLQSFFNKKLSASQRLAELLTIHFAEVEKVKKGKWGEVLDIDVRPNRAPDCFSHLGIAREISAITGLSLREPFSEFGEEKKIKAKDFISVEVKNKRACPRYSARVVIGVKIGPSPGWVQDRLRACGLRPINNVVDIANYVMLETGQPLHAFDLDKLEADRRGYQRGLTRKIIVRFAKKNEKIITLDGEKYDLNEKVLVIADAKKPIAIAGIKGGKPPEISKSTNSIVLESANFDSRIIRGSSKELKLKTDASVRFEHGIDPNLTETAINRAVYLIQEVTYGKVARGLVDVYPKKVLPKKVNLDLEYLNSLLGIKIPKSEVKKILVSLEMRCCEKSPSSIEVEVPTGRLDVSIPADLVEEVGRIYGYHKIPAVFPRATLIPPERNLNLYWEKMAKDILKELGLTETYNYSFFSEREADIFGYSKRELIEMENPISREQKYLRASLIPNLLKNIEKNLRYGDQIYPVKSAKGGAKQFNGVKIFELGKIFRPGKSGEARMLAGALAGDEFYQAKGIIDSLLQGMGISSIWYDDYHPTPEESKMSVWYPKKCAEIKTDHQEIGFMGEISSRVLSGLEIAGKAVAFNLDFEKLQKLASEETIYRHISKYPSTVRDLAVLAPRETRVVEVLNKMNAAGGSLVKDIDLFDIYEGEELPDGKKNLAFHIIYQSDQRTLRSEEVDEIQKRIIKVLETNPEWQVRR